MNRRTFVKGAATGAAISVLDWLGWFRRFGVPGTSKELGIAEAAAQSATDPHFLIYWFQEGGWDSYCMFGAVDTRNDATLVIPAGTLQPNPAWSDQKYRPKNYGTAPLVPPNTQGNITYGYLAADGTSLFNDMCVVSSHVGSTFHSGGRWEYHYGKYNYSLSAQRQADERTVMQAFCEAYGANYLLPHISWHRWLADGELSEPSYPEGTGYYEKLGPAYAHTIYGKTPADFRQLLQSMGQVSGVQRSARIRAFVDNLHDNFIADKNSESVKAFSSAVQIHRSLVSGNMTNIDPATMFTDPQLLSEFGVTAADQQITSTSVNGNPARSKETPNTNVQALMAYELMTKGISIGFWIESRQIRGFDTHRNRSSVFSNKGQTDQLNMMKSNLWTPLEVLVSKLKSTPYGTSGKSYWDYTTIVLASEMGRTLSGDVNSILTGTDDNATKYQKIQDQDVCQHWRVSSCAFLGGSVRGNAQFGRVGTTSFEGIPMMPDGTLDPAYDPVTGALKSGMTKSANSFVSDAGHVYSTALWLQGLDATALKAASKGRNDRPPMKFVHK